VSLSILPLVLLLTQSVLSGEGCVCSAGPPKWRSQMECGTGNGCWLLQLDTGEEQRKSLVGGCFQEQASYGRDVLYRPVSGDFQHVSVGDIVAVLKKGHHLNINVLGDPQKVVSIRFKEKPLQLVLRELERVSGIPVETLWLPELSSQEKFAFAAQGKARSISLLLYALGGQQLTIPASKEERFVKMDLPGTTLSEVRTALLKELE